MTKTERKMLTLALADLETNPCQWEDAMCKIYALLARPYFDHRTATGGVISIFEASALAASKSP